MKVTILLYPPKRAHWFTRRHKWCVCVADAHCVREIYSGQGLRKDAREEYDRTRDGVIRKHVGNSEVVFA